jgi:exonuclease VII small subunit
MKVGMIIIKNYKMPHNCYACDLHNYHECDLTSESIEEDYCWNGDSREKHCPLREVEAIPKDQYEARLRADMVAMLTELQLEIEELDLEDVIPEYEDGAKNTREYITNILEEKIYALKGKG